MSLSGRAPFYGLLCFVAYSLLVMSVEWELIPAQSRVLYLAVKLPVVLVCLPAALVLRRKPRSLPANLVVGIAFIIYPAFSEWFRVNYEYAYFQLMTAYALCFQVSRRLFLSVAFLSGAAFALVYWQRFETLRPLIQEPKVSDGLLSVGAFFVVAGLIFQFVNHERRWREAALTRFSLIGQQAASIIHDVKNVIATPALQLEILKERLGRPNDPEILTLVHEIEAHIGATNKLIYDLSQMARLAERKPERVCVAEVCDEVRELLSNKLRGTTVAVSGELKITGDRALLYSILLNLFLNSLKQIQAHHEPTITIQLGPGCCRFQDNGAGFSASVLQDLARGKPTSTSGSGLGLYIVASAAQDLGGEPRFYNSDSGAVVELRFA